MKNKTFHFNFVDIIIICLSAVIFVLLFVLFLLGNSNYDLIKKDTVLLTINIEDIPYVQNDSIKINNKITLADTNRELGKIKNVSYSHSAHFDDNTNKIDYYYPEFLDAEIVVECSGTVEKDSVIINGNTYSVSDLIYFHVPEFSGKGKITSFEVIQ